MCDTNALSFQVARQVKRAVYNSGLYIDVWEIKYQPEPIELGEKKRYRIHYYLQETGSVIYSEECFDNEHEAISYSFSDEVISKAKQQLNQIK
ncbi:MAG: hypothetical protein LBT50_07970 [Prevotellaceae bacterium]|jgi:hypothetical protein|nr:hypothetical protein [Prevotellaceae bacterium]